jgi:hypothetical protein
MLTINNLDALVTPAVVAIFNEADRQLSQRLQYTKLGYVDYWPTFDAPQFQNISGADEAVLTLEGQPYSQEDLIQNYNTEIKVVKYTKTITISEETVHWIQKGNKEKAQKFRNTVKAVANALNKKIDREAAKLFYLGFGTTFQTGGDGKALFANDHPSPDSSVATQRNIFAASEGHLPLTKDALQLAAQRVDRYFDIKGVQLERCQKLCLVVARENEENAKKILYSIQGPDTANLGINPMEMKHSRIEYEVADWIPTAYSTYWFVVDKERASEALYMIWGWKPRINDESNYNNGTLYKAGSVYFKPGFTDWRWAFGSKGDESAIT